MLSAGGDFTTEFRGPVQPQEGRAGQREPHCGCKRHRCLRRGSVVLFVTGGVKRVLFLSWMYHKDMEGNCKNQRQRCFVVESRRRSSAFIPNKQPFASNNTFHALRKSLLRNHSDVWRASGGGGAREALAPQSRPPPRRGGGRSAGRGVKTQARGSRKPKTISAVDIWMPGMPRMAAGHFWLCLCGDEWRPLWG